MGQGQTSHGSGSTLSSWFLPVGLTSLPTLTSSCFVSLDFARQMLTLGLTNVVYFHLQTYISYRFIKNLHCWIVQRVMQSSVFSWESLSSMQANPGRQIFIIIHILIRDEWILECVQILYHRLWLRLSYSSQLVLRSTVTPNSGLYFKQLMGGGGSDSIAVYP